MSRHVNEVKLNEATSANSQDDSVRESISARSIEIKQLATGIMSLLTPDDDELSSNQTKDEHASNAGNSRSHGHGMNERKKTNLFCWFGDGTDEKLPLPYKGIFIGNLASLLSFSVYFE